MEPPDNDKLVRRISVLVVDDDEAVREVLVEYLLSLGFKRIRSPSDSREAAQLLCDRMTQFDLVLADWRMPGVDGLDLLKLTKKLPFRADTKFIMVSSQVPEERAKIEKARAAGVDAYIVKPFKRALLKDKIWAALGWAAETDDSNEDPSGQSQAG